MYSLNRENIRSYVAFDFSGWKYSRLESKQIQGSIHTTVLFHKLA